MPVGTIWKTGIWKSGIWKDGIWADATSTITEITGISITFDSGFLEYGDFPQGGLPLYGWPQYGRAGGYAAKSGGGHQRAKIKSFGYWRDEEEIMEIMAMIASSGVLD